MTKIKKGKPTESQEKRFWRNTWGISGIGEATRILHPKLYSGRG
jgi:hypothetical protein